MQEDSYVPTKSELERTANVEIKEFVAHGIPVFQTHIKSENAAAALGKACGLYITIATGSLNMVVDGESVCKCLIEQLKPLLCPFFGKKLCICGIGNQELAADSLGPETIRRFTPPMYESLPIRSNFEKVFTVCPGVKGLTNIGTERIIASVSSAIDADCLLIIDACICEKIQELCSNIQLSDTGMRSFSQEVDLNETVTELPIVSIGVPTSVRILDSEGGREVMLAPLQVAESVKSAAFIIACAIIQIIYPELDYETSKKCINASLYGIM